MLRDCGEPATRVCGQCARPACREHSQQHEDKFLCTECLGRLADEDGVRDNQWRDDHDDEWTHGYRHHYYRRSHYRPFYTGHYYDSYYDEYDTRAFDKEVAEPVETDEETGGFFDS
ncbi:MAG: hypothetical protein GY731_01185 [Gammaproteobacteria bacterium]|nr:hypothetical protein [Gammaproteobacteria bacterium]